MHKLILITLITVFILPSQASAYRIPERDYWSAYALKLINNSREVYGLPLLGLDERLNEMAQYHVQDSVINFDDSAMESRRESYLGHISSDGRELSDRLRDHRLIDDIYAAGENVGFRLRGPIEDVHKFTKEALDLMHDGMMAEVPPDDGHRRTILGDYTHVGIGIELHKDSSNEINTLFIVADYAKFPEGTIVRIPEIGSPPPPLLIADLQEQKGEEEQPATPASARRKRLRPVIDPLLRRVVGMEDSSITSPPETESIMPSADNSWLERNRIRIEARRAERVKRLLERVEERRQNRIERRK